MINQELNSLENCILKIQCPEIKFCLKPEKTNNKALPNFRPVVRVGVPYLELAGQLPKPLNKETLVDVMNDNEVATLLKQKVYQMQRIQFQKQIDDNSIDQQQIFNYEINQITGPNPEVSGSARRQAIDNSIIQISYSGFQSLSTQELDQDFSHDEELDQIEVKDQDLHQELFKCLRTELQRRQELKKAADSEFLEILQMNNDDEEEDENEECKTNKKEDQVMIDESELPEETGDKIESKSQYGVDIGFGINKSQNQNELRKIREEVNPPVIVPSGGDILEMFDKQNNNHQSGDSQKKKIVSKAGTYSSEIIQSSIDEEDNTNRVQMINGKSSKGKPVSANKKLDEQINVQEEEEPNEDKRVIEFDKEHYDQWVSSMTKSKYDHYIAWFNIHIKNMNAEVNEKIEKADKNNDFRIKVENKVVDQLKETAHRRAQAALSKSGKPVDTHNPKIEKIDSNFQKVDQLNKQTTSSSDQSDRNGGGLTSKSRFFIQRGDDTQQQQSKKRKFEEFQESNNQQQNEQNTVNGGRTYKKLKHNEFNNQQQPDKKKQQLQSFH